MVTGVRGGRSELEGPQGHARGQGALGASTRVGLGVGDQSWGAAGSHGKGGGKGALGVCTGVEGGRSKLGATGLHGVGAHVLPGLRGFGLSQLVA